LGAFLQEAEGVPAIALPEILPILQGSGQSAMEGFRQQEAETSPQQGQHAQDNLGKRREDAPRVQDVGAEEGEGVAGHVDCSHSLTPNAGGDQLGGILGSRVVGHCYSKATHHGEAYQQGGGCR